MKVMCNNEILCITSCLPLNCSGISFTITAAILNVDSLIFVHIHKFKTPYNRTQK